MRLKDIMSINAKYGIDTNKVERHVKLAEELNLHIYDIATLCNLYSDDNKVRQNAELYRYDRKFTDWYDGKRRITDVDKFRPAAIAYNTMGAYTNLTVNRHPSSQWSKFWREEARRCLYGYHTGDDWISGYNYFYLNYSPIVVVKDTDSISTGGRKRAERVTEFPWFWDGDYYYYHYLEEAERQGLSAAVLKARGRGYSFKGASMLNRNFFLIPKSMCMAFVEDKRYLTEDGLFTKAWDIMSFINGDTPWAKRRSKVDKILHRRASIEITEGGVKKEKGFKSEIMGISLKDDPDKARGKRSKLIMYEEAGSFKDLVSAWIINDASVAQGDRVYGLRVAFGTGGEEGAGFEGLKNLYMKPNTFKVLSVPDVWNKNARQNRVGFFMPEYVNREGYYDKDGNSDMVAAKAAILKEREELIKEDASAIVIAKKNAEQPMTPQEAMLRTEGSPFPVIDLRNHLHEVESKKIYKGASSVGSLVINQDGVISWIEDMTGKMKPIRNNEITEDNRRGAIEIFQHPVKDDTGKARAGLYIAGTDPIDLDRDEVGASYSLGSTFVMNALTEQIVAEYTARPDTADDYYEVVRRLCLYYNCKVMYENNLKGMFVYFSNMRSEYLLADKPKILEDALNYRSHSNRRKGYTATQKVNAYGRELIKKWLTKLHNDVLGTKKLHTINSIGLLNELIDWYKDGNFDRVSALIALMIHLADVDKIVQSMTDISEKVADPFWERVRRR